MLPRILLVSGCTMVASSLAVAAEFDAATATNLFGLELFRREAAKSPDTNLVLSPYSIESAMTLVYPGADGVTKAELANALHFPANEREVQSSFARLRTALAQAAVRADQWWARSNPNEQLPATEWHVAHRLFAQRGYAIRTSFLNLMKDDYAAPMQEMDFAADPESARIAINGWVEAQTRQKIRDLIPMDGVKATTALVLVNALYLKAPWQNEFAKAATKPRPFYFSREVSSDVATMGQTAHMNYAEEKGVQVVGIDYLGDELQCLVILPNPKQTVDELVAMLTPEHLTRWAQLGEDRRSTYITLFLPKFKIEGHTLAMGKTMRELGIKSAFDEPAESANFDGIAPRKANGQYLKFSEVYHQTFIALDEKGTEAAAATAVAMIPTGAAAAKGKPLEVRIDRPFLFAIQHRASGVCLFLGRVTDPR